ncbi:MAG: molecular chaperone TorD family protein [Deltaproteobacteria bacterium]|nr:molecular chaperone TorD family protein [Deltaproteobacteria bacterium]MBW2570815.1 molecular chaperone TorD family protein [Deltaproteobacteria bacterium]MBW2668313.1 molecular chaperone TorD family protein [Deltaproteobacteria bacterium]MBW2710333.1 molecular chaperone TorD family protein [Deltaproteobacteria bacterium]
MNQTEMDENRTAAGNRSNIYGMLALVYRQEMSSDLLKQVKGTQFLEILTDLEAEGTEEIDAFLQKPEAELLEDLAVEYTRLFLGPGKHISPHESVHHQQDDGQWGKLWGASTAKVKKFVESTGLTYSEDFKGLPDHIAVELEFMQQLTLREEQAWMNADADAAVSCRQTEKKFIEGHLVRWIPDFCKNVMQQAELPFYRALAALTRSFIEFEIQEMNRNGDGVN